MPDETLEKQTCPVCRVEPLDLPHGVCRSCLERFKRDEAHEDRAYWEIWEMRYYKRDDIQRTPEQLKKTIDTHIKYEMEHWKSLTENGLSAVRVMIEILDAVDGKRMTNAWHRRRVVFISELITLLDEELFAPVTKEQVRRYMETAIGYWNGTLSDKERQAAFDGMKRALLREKHSTWDAKALLLWMTLKEEFFDWMWYQWFDCVWSCLKKKELDDKTWLGLFQKHFADVIRDWVTEVKHA
ncbi:MAG: hypothetical protein LBD04_09845 [Synergistaceae bacterium]|nr:hypothetical protein [Synergistaceae bacterium]